jgi:hypothetical protein
MNTKTIIKQAETDTLAEILTWVREVVEGRGQSVSQMVVTVVLGCIPGVGQALDAYNILRAIYQLTRDSDNADNWIELVLCLIALVPLFGDALKNVFRMLRSGMPMGRILDSLPRDVRGNIEKWFRELDWAGYTRQLVAKVNQILDGMINVLGTRSARWVMDKQGLDRLEDRTGHGLAAAIPPDGHGPAPAQHHRGLPRQPPCRHPAPVAARLIGTGIQWRQRRQAGPAKHQHRQPDPGRLIHTGSPARHARYRRQTASANRQPDRRLGPGQQAAAATRTADKAQQPAPANRDIATEPKGNATPRQGQVSPQQRQSQRSRRNPREIGVSGEHIADYFFVKRQKNRSKINKNGLLYEMKQPDGNLPGGHQGIDHIWHGSRLPFGYRISDTKGTGKGMHRLETPKRVFEALRYGLDSYMGTEDESRLGNNLGDTKDGRQLSHRWVAARIDKAEIVAEHTDLVRKIRQWEAERFKAGTTIYIEDGTPRRVAVKCPYDRSLITVVGANHNLHDRRKGKSRPRCAKGQASHQIGTEFVIPTDILIG